MSDNSLIEWTDATWNPVTGCTKVSAGCDHCYAERVTERFNGKGSFATVTLHPDRLDQPLRWWRRPRLIFVNSMSDLFHDAVPDEFIAQVFAVMAAAPQHTFQVLTKRHARMRALAGDDDFRVQVAMDRAALELSSLRPGEPLPDLLPSWPLPNVWLGVSVEDQQWADIRIPALLTTPAAVRFLSCEPLLDPVDLSRWTRPHALDCQDANGDPPWCTCGRDRDGYLDWVIVGGESGPGARPMHPAWARKLRDQCAAAGVPFHFKQWGEWIVSEGNADGPAVPLNWADQPERYRFLRPDGTNGTGYDGSGGEFVVRVGKKAAGRELDGRVHDGFPGATA